MNSFGLKFHHMGLAISDVKKASIFVKSLGYELSKVVSDPLQRVDLIMCSHTEMPSIELVFNESNHSDSPISSILKYQKESIYHLCYSCCHIEETISLLKSVGIKILKISSAKPAILFDGRYVAFYFISGFGLIELLEEENRP